MNPEDIEIPSPEEVLEEVENMGRKVHLGSYRESLEAMRNKGYSYAEIAAWFSKRLDAEITRSQVSYVINAPAVVQDEDAEAKHDQRTQDEIDAMEDALK